MNKYLSIIIIILVIALSFLSKCNRDLTYNLNQKNGTIIALTDSIKIIKNKKTGVVTLQKIVFTERIKPNETYLNKNQKELFKHVDKKTIAAAHIISSVDIQNVTNYTPTVTSDTTRVFTSATDTLSYTITTKADTLTINQLTVPNTAVITFTEDKKKMVVNVVNSNPLLKTQDIQGYVMQKKKVTLWQKIKLILF